MEMVLALQTQSLANRKVKVNDRIIFDSNHLTNNHSKGKKQVLNY